MSRPEGPLLEFDGECGICTRLARWVEEHLPSGSDVHVVPWQALDLTSIGLTANDVARYAWWIEPGRAPRRGHRAISAALQAVGGRWATAGRALQVPPISWLAGLAYQLVAHNRHRLRRFGITPACAHPSADCRKPKPLAPDVSLHVLPATLNHKAQPVKRRAVELAGKPGTDVAQFGASQLPGRTSWPR